VSTDDEDETQVDLALVREREYADRVTKVLCVYFEHNQVPVERIGDVIAAVTQGLVGNASGQSDDPAGEGDAVDDDADGEASSETPAVSIRKSVTDEHLFCLCCGKGMAVLKKHLRTAHELTPREYREKWGLNHDYPMSSPAYVRKRSAEASARGFGRKKDSDD